MKLRSVILSLTAFSALLFTGCGDETVSGGDNNTSGSLIGTWASTMTTDEDGTKSTASITAKFENPDKITYTALVTEITSDGKTYKGSELDAFFSLAGVTNPITMTGTWKTSGNKLFVTMMGETDTSDYSISGNKLTVQMDGTPMTLTKQ